MPWVVAEFLPHREFDDVTVQTIPYSWINRVGGKLFALYPSGNCKSTVVRRMIVKQMEPCDEWDVLPLRYVTTPFETLHAATQLEIEVVGCEETDLEAFLSSSERLTRKRKVKDQRYPGESNSDTECSDIDYLSDPPAPGLCSGSHGPSVASTSKTGMVSVTGESRAGLKKAVEKRMASSNGLHHNAGKRSMLPKPSVTKSSGLNGKAGKGNMLPEMRMSKNPGVNVVEAPMPSTCSSGLPRMKKNGGVLLTKKGMDSQLLHEKSPMSQSLLSKLQTHANEFSSTVKSFSEEMGSDARRDAGKFGRDDYNFRRFEARMMTELQEIKESIQALSLKIDSLPATEDKDEEVQLLHDLPLQRLEDLTEFQEAVRSNIKYRSFMVKYLRCRCSNALYQSSGKTFAPSLNKIVNDVCASIMCNDLSRLFCMTGRASQKIPFEAEYPHIIDLIFDAVKQKNINGVPLDMVVVKRSIGEWFRLSRVRGRSKAAVAESQNEDIAIFEILDESNIYPC